MHQTELQISIARKGKGITDTLTGFYTMHEHANSKPIEDGKAFAAKKYPNEHCVVQVSPLENIELENAVANEYGLSGKQIALPKVHNPLQSCFTAYSAKTIAGVELLVYEVSFGVCFAEVNKEWLNESKAA